MNVINKSGDINIMLRGSKVYLSEYSKDELKLVKDLINDWDIQEYLNPDTIIPLTYEDELEWFESNRKHIEKDYSFAIRTIEDNIYLGGCGYRNVNYKNRTCYIGIMISNKEFQNKGYGSEALDLLINYIFYEMNLRKIILMVFSNNERAIHVYKKLGFHIEGTLKEQVFRNGKYIDEHIMAKFVDREASALLN